MDQSDRDFLKQVGLDKIPEEPVRGKVFFSDASKTRKLPSLKEVPEHWRLAFDLRKADAKLTWMDAAMQAIRETGYKSARMHAEIIAIADWLKRAI